MPSIGFGSPTVSGQVEVIGEEKVITKYLGAFNSATLSTEITPTARNFDSRL